MNPIPAPWWMLPALATYVLTIFACALIAACFLGNETLLTAMFTATVTLATGAVGYFFGSSAGSQKKDDTLAAVAQSTGSAPTVIVPPPVAPPAPAPPPPPAPVGDNP